MTLQRLNMRSIIPIVAHALLMLFSLPNGVNAQATATSPVGPATQATRPDNLNKTSGTRSDSHVELDWLAFPDAAKFGVLGLAWFNVNQPKLWRMPERRFDALPAGVKNRCREPSGGRILIRCNSANLGLKVLPLNKGNLKGFDVYVDGKPLKALAAGAPEAQTEVILFKGLDRKQKEIVIYLPHRQEVIVTAVGVDKDTMFGAPQRKYARPLPVVYYGSSVCQGNGASKPGTTYAATLGRELNLDFINLGFGGAGKAEENVVDLVNSIPACCYVFDLGKSYGVQDKTAYQRMLQTIRKSHPDVPMICITPITSAREVRDEDYSKRSVHTRTVMREAVQDLIQAGAKNLHLVEGEDLLGFDEHDGLSKDGVHPSDQGYGAIARKLAPMLGRVLGL